MNEDTEYDNFFEPPSPPRSALHNRPSNLLPAQSPRFLPQIENPRPYHNISDFLRTGESQTPASSHHLPVIPARTLP